MRSVASEAEFRVVIKPISVFLFSQAVFCLAFYGIVYLSEQGGENKDWTSFWGFMSVAAILGPVILREIWSNKHYLIKKMAYKIVLKRINRLKSSSTAGSADLIAELEDSINEAVEAFRLPKRLTRQ